MIPGVIAGKVVPVPSITLGLITHSDCRLKAMDKEIAPHSTIARLCLQHCLWGPLYLTFYFLTEGPYTPSAQVHYQNHQWFICLKSNLEI